MADSKDITKSMKLFKQSSNFQKTIISLLSGLITQKDELAKLKTIFIQMDKDQSGKVSMEELQVGLSKSDVIS
jgi:Ca2+-binding EF-hand superfamily protein